MEYVRGSGNICLSGGADGADIEWGKCAQEIGHKVIHWSFAGHQSQAAEQEIVRLTDEQLNVGVGAVTNAARALDKRPPHRPTVARLIRRNYYQVAWSNSCYAITVIKKDAVAGGTAWATTMFSQLHPKSRNLWVFDQDQDAWFQFDGEDWVRIDTPPTPEGIWAGIGSRDLRENGRMAIRKLMGRVNTTETDG